MKNIFIVICSLFFTLTNGQERKVYSYLVELNHYSNAPTFRKEGNKLMYEGKETDEKQFFSKYTILHFYQSFPASKRERTLNMFTITTSDRSLIDDMMTKFPGKYVRVEDISDVKYELLSSYPNDYGTTSPVSNLGVPHSLKHLDYINAPKAWDYTYGSSSVVIGMSDTNIDMSDIDFKFKTTFLSSYNDPPNYTPPYSMSNDSWHGTATTAFAAAQGNNGNGMVGVCSNCSVLATKCFDYNNLLELAQAGARVINMSWGSYMTTPTTTYQWLIDEIHEDYGTIMVGAAGNISPYSTPYTGTLYFFPASYDHVISVTSVNHKNNNWTDETVTLPDWGQVSRYVADQIGPSVVTNYNGNGPYSFYNATHTYNERVDICAPGYEIFQYPWYVLNHNLFYGSGTSGAAPIVTGTIGLLLSINPCLNSDEVEDILQLTSKNLEKIAGNEPYIGKSGAGKLETGDAVEFAFHMARTNGNAVIDGNDFYRFNFDLKRINNKLTISNQIFRESCTANFTAKNSIEILPGSDFKPNENGLVDLTINPNIIVTCKTITKSNEKDRSNDTEKDAIKTSLIRLYPNPNNGAFEISLARDIKESVNVEVYDIFGKAIYKTVKEGSSFAIDIPNLATGMYIVKINSGQYNETIKFIKE